MQDGRLHSTSLADDRMARPAELSARQIAILIGWAILLWFAAAQFVHFTPDRLFDRGAATAIAFAAAAPLAWLTVRATRRIAALRPDQIVMGVALSSASAMLCDGIAFTWTSIYGAAPKDLLVAAAWLLWGVGLIIVAAFVTARRARA